MLVSIIIPAFNRESTIAASVESALAQDHPKIEVIVVDDGSTDGTIGELERFGDRIVVIRQPNAGPSAARNRGVANAKGEIVAFLDSDDLWLPGKVSRQVALMERASSRLVCCVCNAEVKGRADTRSETRSITREFVPTSSRVFGRTRRRCFPPASSCSTRSSRSGAKRSTSSGGSTRS